MNSFIIFSLVLFVANIADAQTTVAGSFGIASSVTANTLTTINFGLANTPPSLDVYVSSDTTVKVDLFAQASLNAMGSLPTGYSAIGVAAAFGFSVT